jgi:hypothetical protein
MDDHVSHPVRPSGFDFYLSSILETDRRCSDVVVWVFLVRRCLLFDIIALNHNLVLGTAKNSPTMFPVCQDLPVSVPVFLSVFDPEER